MFASGLSGWLHIPPAISWKNSIAGRTGFEVFAALSSSIYLKGYIKGYFNVPLTYIQKNILFDTVENIVDDQYVGPTEDALSKPNYTGDIYIYQHKDEDAVNLEKEGCTRIVFIAGFETVVEMDGFFDRYVGERDFTEYPSIVSFQNWPEVSYKEVQSALEKSPGLFKFVAHKKLHASVNHHLLRELP